MTSNRKARVLEKLAADQSPTENLEQAKRVGTAAWANRGKAVAAVKNKVNYAVSGNAPIQAVKNVGKWAKGLGRRAGGRSAGKPLLTKLPKPTSGQYAAEHQGPFSRLSRVAGSATPSKAGTMANR